jgi:ABC-type transport system involved in cytochrome bd biosynthesis fused ATPase/permease subunit
MGILRALGIGLFFLILALLMPTVFFELTKTLVVFLQSSQEALTAAGILASYAGHIPNSVHP